MVAATGTTTLGFFVWTFAVTVMGWLATVVESYLKLNGQKIQNPLTQSLQDSWFTGLLLLAGVTVLLVLAWAVSTVVLIYKEHQSLLGERDQIKQVLTPLQLEIFQLSKDLREFYEEVGPEKEAEPGHLISGWRERVRHTYATRYAMRVEAVVHKLGVMEIQSASIFNLERCAIDIENGNSLLSKDKLAWIAYNLDVVAAIFLNYDERKTDEFPKIVPVPRRPESLRGLTKGNDRVLHAPKESGES
jgi:hypothetical protein